MPPSLETSRTGGENTQAVPPTHIQDRERVDTGIDKVETHQDFIKNTGAEEEEDSVQRIEKQIK